MAGSGRTVSVTLSRACTSQCVLNTPDSFPCSTAWRSPLIRNFAVHGRYKEYLCPSVLKRFLRYMQSDRCPISSFVCNRLSPFHGDNTGSNPVGDAKLNHSAKPIATATHPRRIRWQSPFCTELT